MKSKFLTLIFAALFLSDCEKKSTVLPSNFPMIEKTVKDTTLPDYIRGSAATFDEVLSEKQGVTRSRLSDAHWEMVQFRDTKTIASYVEFLKSLEKKLPERLPEVEIYEAMSSKAGKAKFIEYNVAQIVLMMSNSIQNITLYDDRNCDLEIKGILNRLNEKYKSSEAGKIVLELLNTVHSHGLEQRMRGTKPWELPRKPPVYIPSSE